MRQPDFQRNLLVLRLFHGYEISLLTFSLFSQYLNITIVLLSAPRRTPNIYAIQNNCFDETAIIGTRTILQVLNAPMLGDLVHAILFTIYYTRVTRKSNRIDKFNHISLLPIYSPTKNNSQRRNYSVCSNDHM